MYPTFSSFSYTFFFYFLLFFFFFFFFFFNDTATTEIYTLSLHDALPIYAQAGDLEPAGELAELLLHELAQQEDRKSTRLNSSHQIISYAVFCLKKKKKKKKNEQNITKKIKRRIRKS